MQFLTSENKIIVLYYYNCNMIPVHLELLIWLVKSMTGDIGIAI